MNSSYNIPESPKYTFEMPNRTSVRNIAQKQYFYVDGYDNAFVDGAEYMANRMGMLFIDRHPEMKEEIASFCQRMKRDPKTICIPVNSNKEYFDILDKRCDTIAMSVNFNPQVGDKIYVPAPKWSEQKDVDKVLQVSGVRATVDKVIDNIPGLADKVLVVCSDIQNLGKDI